MDRLDDTARSAFLAEYPEWDIDGENLSRTFVFADFIGSMGFVCQAAMLSEMANHHPDIDIRWNKVSLTLTTHEVSALTQKDTDLAARITDRT